MDLTAALSTSGETTIVTVVGDVDSYSASTLTQALQEAEAGSGPVVVDLTGVTFLNSAGLGALVGAHKRLLDASRPMRLVCSDESVLRLFQITDLNEVFTINSTLDEALAKVRN